MIYNGTPWETYELGGKRTVHVKRDDLSVEDPGPHLSKTRGICKAIMAAVEARGKLPVVAIDEGHSAMGWAAAYACTLLDLQCHNFYPQYKSEQAKGYYTIRHNQIEAQKLGAELHPLPATRYGVMYGWARKEMGKEAIYIRNAADVYQAISDDNCFEVERFTPIKLLEGTWVIPTSSAASAIGIVRGLRNSDVNIMIYCCHTRDTAKLAQQMQKYIPYVPRWTFIDEHKYTYEQALAVSVPFPANPYYETKAWQWMVDNYRFLAKPVVFWNIGA